MEAMQALQGRQVCCLSKVDQDNLSFELREKDLSTIVESKKDPSTIDTPKKIYLPLLTPHTDF